MVLAGVLYGFLINSFILSLLAMGFTLQYVTMSVPNLAYGSIAFFSTYISLTMVLLNLSPYLGLPISFAICAIISVLLYKFLAFLRDRGMPVMGLMMATLVFDLLAYAFTNIYADMLSSFLQAYGRSFSLAEYDFTIGGTPGVLLVSGIIAVSFALGFHLMLTKTKFGIAMRATVENISLASVQGVNTDKVLLVAWLLVGGIAGVSGSLYPLWLYMDPWVGARMFVSIFAACVVGGIRSIYGSLFGGFLIAACETVITYELSLVIGEWIWPYRTVISLLIAAVFLLFAPNGVAGLIERARRR
ncbi:MAG: branched-chain amino acid ABC transporter permease [Thaumarchaeota archaeon]|nr:branched-chain amino acid ABC transporter permease [Nitrososphaerota archaeon]